MRVFFITRKWPPAVGGMEVYSVAMAEKLAQIADLRLRALPGRRDGRPPSLIALAGFLIGSLWAIARHGRGQDVILLGDLLLFPCALAARLAAPHSRVIVTLHGTDVAFGRRSGALPRLYRLYLGLVRLCGWAADEFVANSQATAALAREIGLPRVRVVPLGVRLPPSALTEAVEPVLLFTGRVTQRKGVNWFADHVLPLLDARYRLRVVGTVWDQAEGDRLRANPRVELVGPRFGAELDQERRRALAIVLPNVALGARDFVEGFGLAAVEGAAAGGIVLASALDGLIDAVADGETGFLLPSRDAEAWAERIHTLAGWSAAQRANFLAGARRVLAERYCWERVARETLALSRSDGAESPDPPRES